MDRRRGAAGAAWGAFTIIVFACAVSLSRGRATTGGAGTAAGLLFSAIALGNVLRLGVVAAGWSKAALVAWLPEPAWLVAAALLVVAVRRWWRPPPLVPRR